MLIEIAIFYICLIYLMACVALQELIYNILIACRIINRPINNTPIIDYIINTPIMYTAIIDVWCDGYNDVMNLYYKKKLIFNIF
jgi:hypothetical protein